MAKQTENTITEYKVTVKNNPEYCGKDAGGIAFANGTAIVTDPRMVQWFKEHDGYEVEAVSKGTQA